MVIDHYMQLYGIGLNGDIYGNTLSHCRIDNLSFKIDISMQSKHIMMLVDNIRLEYIIIVTMVTIQLISLSVCLSVCVSVRLSVCNKIITYNNRTQLIFDR